MAYIEGEQRSQRTLFPTTLDELIPQDHVCRVIEAFVGRLDMGRTEFVYDEKSDTFRCPAGQTLWRKQFSKKDRAVTYTPRRKVCGSCALKARCTLGPRRYVSRNLHEDALRRMQYRTTAEVMRLRGSTVEHPFATIKYRIFGYPRFLLRGTGGAQTEISLATMVYNLKRMLHVLGGSQLRAALAG